MARQEQDREDLLHEATAMIERAEFQVSFWPEPVFVGFRRDGCFSVYFGGDPVLQFNGTGELRRAFIDGLLFKAENGRFIELRRVRTEGETALARRDLSEVETASLLLRANELLGQLRGAINGDAGQSTKIVGQVPTDCDVLGRVSHWFSTGVEPIKIAASPRAR
jgi:hypothetical protein